MDDSDHICPLCCEEMDVSDREFYPCKCGYQVCIWCWHKIRKSENGLCPACRTPYGEDPHQFTALDVEEVLRANKEAQTAAKRERHIQNQLLQQQQLLHQQQLLQQQQHSSNSHNYSHGSHAASNNSSTAAQSSSSSSHALSTAAALSNNSHGHDNSLSTSFDATADSISNSNIDGPKDRSSLANLRVIRRNLIYAVGLSPAIANEETLRRPEYFGQYGKLTKVVVNRSSPGGGNDMNDPRRATSSAYITFQFKEDTLACILALDGYYLDNRTIRASYGTSKYCSAFMKHVRCSNPDCTYLHEMGAAEDTFTKQEIQAGYVTSGCDVLARQQQILLEQQKLASSGGQHTSTGGKSTRKRVGGGGPSGTGKPHPNPTFPAPEFEEPVKPSIPTPSSITKASTVGNPAIITQPQSYINATNVPAKLGRTTSAGVLLGAAATSKVANSSNSTSPTVGAGVNSLRKTQSGVVAPATIPANNPTTAASVVASSRRPTTSKDGLDAAQQHSALTALTPLKRTSTIKGPPTKALPVVAEDEASSTNKIPGIRNGKKQASSNTGRTTATTNIPTTLGSNNNKSNSTTASVTSSNLQHSNDISIGGDVIGPSPSLNGWNSNKPLNFGSIVNNTGTATANNTIGSNSSNGSLAELGGMPMPIPIPSTTTAATATLLGGELYTGALLNQSRDASMGSGSGSSLLGGSLLNDFSLSSSSNVAGGEIGLRSGNSSNLWSGSILGGSSTNNVGGNRNSNNNGVIGSHISSSSGSNSSSALASILGINLPTGSGSLQESLWSTPHQPLTGPSPLSMLNESTMHDTQYNQSQQLHNGGIGSQLHAVGPPQPPNLHSSVIGNNRGPIRSSTNVGNAVIGGRSGTIGGSGSVQIGGTHNQQNDIALLQVLLPGVHITSDNGNTMGLRGGTHGWGSDPSSMMNRQQGQQSIGSNRTSAIGSSSGSGNWVGGDANSNSKPMGGNIIGQTNYPHQSSNHGAGIW